MILPVRLTPTVRERVWGSSLTEPWFKNSGGREIGEIWFSAPEAMPVLVKFLFTSEHLSVQVHPDDAYARAHGAERGKTEMWHVLCAEPDSQVAVGLRAGVAGEQLREAALDGSITNLLEWFPARAGDTFFVPAGTIHVLGGGLTICEIQQLSDVTYRMFDYHRKPERQLHLDDALTVARPEGGGGRVERRVLGKGRESLVECEYFRTERLEMQGEIKLSGSSQPKIYISIEGAGQLAGQPFQAGEAWLAGPEPFSIESPEAVFLVVSPGSVSQ